MKNKSFGRNNKLNLASLGFNEKSRGIRCSFIPWITVDHEHTEDDPGHADNLCFKAFVPTISCRVVFSR